MVKDNLKSAFPAMITMDCRLIIANYILNMSFGNIIVFLAPSFSFPDAANILLLHGMMPCMCLVETMGR